MKWFKRILIAFVLLLATAVALPFFISLNDYIPQIEQEISSRLKEPVSIKSIRFTLLPLPYVTLDGIALGGADGIMLGKLRVTPDLFSLLQPVKVIKRVEIDSVTVTQKTIAKISTWAKPDAARSPQQIRVESIQFDNVLVNFGKVSVGPLNAHISLNHLSELADASIATQDGKLRALIKPDPSDKSNYLIDASAKAWTLPAGPALVFDELILKGVVTRHDANFGVVSAKLYGGTAIGKTSISWQRGVQLNGNFDIRHIEVQQVASLLSPGVHVSGKLSAQPAFAATAASADQLINALRLKMFFNVQNGALHDIDIQKAATSLVGQATSGGETRFEQLSGQLVLAQRSYHFTQIRIASGSLAVDGQVTISPKKALSGRINAEVSALGVSTGVPLNVTGTIDTPVLYPTGGTMAGAAVGTVLMGPGFGTSVGAKIGGWAEGLFGTPEAKKSKK
ncbi:MAG: hypothetical protein WC208_04505 [Gallionella sp.]|jgi:uncharacterized protein involved in outer membrane biogenesis